jgi:uncharacterized protein (DUF305 family)
MQFRLMRSVLIISVTAFAVSNAWATCSAESHAGSMHHPMQADHKPANADGAATRAYEAAMATMHQNMRAELSGNPDVDFVRQMIPHHQAAVDMAKIQLQYGHDERLKSLSRWIIRSQEVEIGFMKNWLYRRDNGAVTSGARDYYGDAMATMHHGMMIDYTGNADVDFVRGMIPHHQGAADMASILFTHGTDPDLNKLAKDIWRAQTQEIAWMKCWLADHLGK